MKKRIIRITIFVLLLLVSFGAKAAPSYDAATVNSQLEVYKSSSAEFDALGCNGTLTSQSTVDKCNTLGLAKTNALVYMFNAKEYDEDLISSEVQTVLDQNSSQCSSIFSSSIQNTLNKVFLMFYIAGPILLILFGSMDFFTAMVAGDEKKRKALYTKFVRRVISLLLLFATPVLVRVLVNTFGGEKYSSSVFSCNYTERKISIIYTPTIKGKKKKNKASSQGAAIVEAAKKINAVSSAGDWSYDCVGATSVLRNYRNKAQGAHMCCADYVSAVLVEAGVFSDSDVSVPNFPNWNKEHCGGYDGYPESATGLMSYLITHDWIQITDVDDLQPGDIMFSHTMTDWNISCIRAEGYKRAGHVEVYAGDGMKYNAGKTTHMRSNGPVSAGLDSMDFVIGLRAP